jgi:hypothetical protein
MRRPVPFIAFALLAAAALWWWVGDSDPAPDAVAESEPVAPRVSAVEVPLPAVREAAKFPAAAAPADASTSPEAPAVPPGSTSPPATAFGVPTEMISDDYPPYLGAVASSWFPFRFENGCKSPSALLTDMAEEPRDPLWASRMERELRALLESHPLGFAVSVGCRATICQITAIGPHATALEHPTEAQRFWGLFERRLRASPIAREFATKRFFAGVEPRGTLEAIAGIVLTSVGQASPDEPADCAPFAPAEEPAPGVS